MYTINYLVQVLLLFAALLAPHFIQPPSLLLPASLLLLAIYDGWGWDRADAALVPAVVAVGAGGRNPKIDGQNGRNNCL